MTADPTDDTARHQADAALAPKPPAHVGEVIIAGLLSDNTAFILQGGLVVGIMAVLLYDGMGAAESWITSRMGLQPHQAA